MANTALTDYITTARAKKATDDQIREALLKNGWQENDVNHALNPVKEDIALMAPPAPHFGMWVVFLYLMLFISLYVFAGALAGVLYSAVTDLIPDALDTVGYNYSRGNGAMQGYLACLIVGFPIFALLFIILKKQILKTPAIKGLKIRKVLIYFTLIVTFLIILGHSIASVYGFLGGMVTLRSLANLGVTFLVAGGVFIYFLLDVLGDRKQT